MNTVTKAYDDIVNQMQDRVDKRIDALEYEKYVNYAAYDYDEYDFPVNNLDDIPIKGLVKFVDKDRKYESPVYISPTWLNIAVTANHMIMELKDYQHIYFEDVNVIDQENDVKIAVICMS